MPIIHRILGILGFSKKKVINITNTIPDLEHRFGVEEKESEIKMSNDHIDKDEFYDIERLDLDEDEVDIEKINSSGEEENKKEEAFHVDEDNDEDIDSIEYTEEQPENNKSEKSDRINVDDYIDDIDKYL